MKNFTGLFLLLSVFMLQFFSACEYEFIEPEGTTLGPEDTVSFAQHIIPVFEDKCVSCHNGGLSFDLSAANAYSTLQSENLVVAGDPSGSEIFTVPEPNGSHPGTYTSGESTLVMQWIEQGANNN